IVAAQAARELTRTPQSTRTDLQQGESTSLLLDREQVANMAQRELGLVELWLLPPGRSGRCRRFVNVRLTVISLCNDRNIVRGPDHIPFILIATDERVRMSRLEIIFAVAAWYFLKRSVAKKASSAASLSHTSNSRTWFGSFCETAILSWRPPASFTAAAPSSLIAIRYLSISAGTMSYSTTRMWRGPDCAVACSPRIGNSHAATASASARMILATDFNIEVSLLVQMFRFIPFWERPYHI